MNSFEQQLTSSARRLRQQTDDKLKVSEFASHNVANRSIRSYWGWIATPAAAAVGLLIGLSVDRPADDNLYSGHNTHTTTITPAILAADTSGCCIADDGIDYSLLVSL